RLGHPRLARRARCPGRGWTARSFRHWLTIAWRDVRRAVLPDDGTAHQCRAHLAFEHATNERVDRPTGTQVALVQRPRPLQVDQGNVGVGPRLEDTFARIQTQALGRITSG